MMDQVNPGAGKKESNLNLEFTGERLVPGKVDPDLFNEHLARYMYARQFCSGKDVLDTGCGVGYGSRFVSETARTVVGIDNDVGTIGYARSNFSSANVNYLVGDCHKLPFPAATFDVVTSFELIEHLADARAYLAEVRRVLKPDGVLTISTPNHSVYAEHRGDEVNPFHVQEWDFEQFASFLKEHFSHIEFLGENHVATVAIIAEGADQGVPATLEKATPPRQSDYLVCVCSQCSTELRPGIVFVPATGNVLLERERHISALNAEVSRLQSEFADKARWADQLNSDLSRTRLDFARLEGAQERLKAEVVDKTRQNKRLMTEVEILAAMWRKETRFKRLLAFVLLWPLDWLAAACVIGVELLGRVVRAIFPEKPPQFPAPKPECSFLIVSWNGKDLLAESLPPLLEAVHRQGGNHEVIVVDNGSVDGTAEFVRQHFPEVLLVRSDENLYFSGGNRLGLERASRDIVVLLNNDMIVDRGFLEPLLKPFSEPEVFGVGSQVFLPAGRPRQETGKTRADFNGADLDWKHAAISAYDEKRGYVPVFWLHGGAAAIDRRKYEWLGGLDPLYDPFYVEDADLSYRAWKAGWRCLLAVDSHVLHKHRSSTQRFGEGFIRGIVRRNQYVFFWKNVGDAAFLLKNFLHAPRLRARRAGMIGVGIKCEIHSYLGALKRLPTILRAKFRIARSEVRTDRRILEIINEPDRAAISFSDVDFARGAYDEQLSGEWYNLEQKEGRPHRWIGQNASVMLRIPASNVELMLQGYVPPLSRYPRPPVSLILNCQDQLHRFELKEGEFSHSVNVRGLSEGEAVKVGLELNQTFNTGQDERKLGIILHRIALLSNGRSSVAREGGGANSVSLSGHSQLESTSSREPAKRLLVICAYLPCLGIHGGGTVMYHLIRQLSRKYKITILSFFENERERELAPLLAPYCERLEALRRGQSLDTPNLLGLKPPEIAYEFYNQQMVCLVRDYLRSGSFDLVDCQYLQTGHFLLDHPEIPALLTHHEVYSLSIMKQGEDLPWASRRLEKFVEWMRMLNYEERILRRFSSVMVFTEAEKRYLNRYMPKVRVQVHPTGVDCEFFAPKNAVPERDSVMFLGNFRHQPNVSGILWFLENSWPLIRRDCTQAKLYVVGTEPPASVQRWHGKEGVIVTGQVADVRPYLQNSAVCVAPLFQGAGLRGKVLESWAMERPVVGTPLAFLGLTAQEAGLLADDAESMASSVCRLLRDDELRSGMGVRARHLALTKYSWEAFADFYDIAYRETMRNENKVVCSLSGTAGNTEENEDWRDRAARVRSV